MVAMNKWQDITDMEVRQGKLMVMIVICGVGLLNATRVLETLDLLSEHCR